PHATHARRRDDKPALPQLVGNAQLTEGRLLERERNDGLLDLLEHPILQHWLLAADLLQRQFPAAVVELFEAIKAVPAIAHHLAGLADIAELLGEFQQPDFRTNDLLFRRHVPVRRGGALRDPDRSVPRPGSRFAVGTRTPLSG